MYLQRIFTDDAKDSDVSPSNSPAETRMFNVSICEDRACEEVLKLK